MSRYHVGTLGIYIEGETPTIYSGRAVLSDWVYNIKKISERDTSKTCSLCGEQYNGRVHRGLIVCKQTHQSLNADLNGAINILKVAVNRPLVRSTDEEASGSKLMVQPLHLRWNYNEWL